MNWMLFLLFFSSYLIRSREEFIYLIIEIIFLKTGFFDYMINKSLFIKKRALNRKGGKKEHVVL